MDHHDEETLIAVADDCPVQESVVPDARGEKRTIAQLDYELLADAPHQGAQGDVLFATGLRRQGLAEQGQADVDSLREAFFSKPRACLRTSPLPKRHGWGLHCDANGRVALVLVRRGDWAALMGRAGVEGRGAGAASDRGHGRGVAVDGARAAGGLLVCARLSAS